MLNEFSHVFYKYTLTYFDLRLLSGVEHKNTHTMKFDLQKNVEESKQQWKIRNRYNQAPHLAQDINGKVTFSQLDITNEIHMGLDMYTQSELPRPIPWNFEELDLRCTSRINFDNMTLTLYNAGVTKPFKHNNKSDCSKTNGYNWSLCVTFSIKHHYNDILLKNHQLHLLCW